MKTKVVAKRRTPVRRYSKIILAVAFISVLAAGIFQAIKIKSKNDSEKSLKSELESQGRVKKSGTLIAHLCEY